MLAALVHKIWEAGYALTVSPDCKSVEQADQGRTAVSA